MNRIINKLYKTFMKRVKIIKKMNLKTFYRKKIVIKHKFNKLIINNIFKKNVNKESN